MFHLIVNAVAHCHQVPSPSVVMHHLGLFYMWHLFNTVPQARMVCK